MRALFTTAVLAAGLVGCGGPTLADALGDEVVISLTAVSSAPDLVGVGEATEGLGVMRLYVSASSFTIMPCSDGASDVVLGARGYDLLVSPAPRERIGTTVTELCGVRIDIDPVSQNALDGIPKGASLYAEGTDANGTAFVFSSDLSTSLLLEAKSGVAFGQEPLLLGVDVSTLFAGIKVADFEAMPAAAQELVETRLPAAFAIYADANEDQGIDEDEREPLASVDQP